MYTNYIKTQHLILRKSHDFLTYSSPDLILQKYTADLKIRDIKKTKPYKIIIIPTLQWIQFVYTTVMFHIGILLPLLQ